MKLVKQIFDFYINASIHVALAVVAFCMLTMLKFELLIDWNFLWFVFFASVTGYNFVKYFGLAKFHHRSLATWLKTIQVFSFFCFLALCYFAFFLHTDSVIFLMVLGVITFFYAIPFLPRKIFMDQFKNLRSIGGLKIFVIAFVWSAVTVVLPIVEADLGMDIDLKLYALQRFIVVLILMLPFEIRDLQYDSLKLATIPQQIGVNATKFLGISLIIIYVVINLAIDETFYYDWIRILILILLLLSILYSKKRQNSYFCSFFVEGIPILWLVLTLVS